MRKKVFITLISLSFAIVFVFSSLFGLMFFTEFKSYSMEALKGVRVTLLEIDGSVIFDNRYDVNLMENHLLRAEVQDAIVAGHGESERYSETTGETTYYYAVRLDESRILRMSLTATGLRQLAVTFVPLLIFSIIVSILTAIGLSGLLTRRIVAPINKMDLESIAVNEYEELSPFVRKIQKQKDEIAVQIAEIKESTSTISTITENMREGLILLDKSGIILLANAAAEYVFDIMNSEGRNIIEIYRESVFMEHVKRCLWGEKSEIEMQMGASIYQTLFSPVYSEEDVTGAAIFLIDITERKAFENQRREFAANVSHELKTPLTTIVGYSEMIANGTAKEEKITQFAKKINDQSIRLQNIINDIISLSEFDEGKKAEQFSEVNPYAVAQNVLEQLKEKADARNISLSLDGMQNLTLNANAMMIESMIYNLVDNGIKYNKENGKVHVAVDDRNFYVSIRVSDTGIGIPPEHRNRVFERFYLVDKSRSKKSGGTGLGLSIVKHIAEYHGGYVNLQSEPGARSTFTVYLKK